MPAATNKTDLITTAVAEYTKLRKLLEDVSEAQAIRKREDDTSIKDVIGHRAHWIDLFLGWYADGQAGKDVAFPAPGYKWNDLKVYNAALREAQAGWSWSQACVALDEAHARLLNFLRGLPDSALYGGPMKGARNDWTTGRWAEASGPSHYRSAAKYIRAALRADRA